VKLSLNLTNYSWSGGPDVLADRVAVLARQADDAGLDTLWVADHLVQVDPTASTEEPMLESYTTLGFLAGVTHRIRLGTMVTWAGIRPAALLVKAVTTVDVLSAGRAWLGIGAGYQQVEATMMGLPFPPTSERFDRLEELLALARQMWAGDRRPLRGRFDQLESPISEPPPVQRPRVLIGGMGELRTIPLVARHGDACNFFDLGDDGTVLRHKLAVLGRACRAIDRDPAEIEVTLSSRLSPGESVEQLVARCEGLRAQGVDHVVLITTGPWGQGPDLDVVLNAADPLQAIH
jgi:alkanesulfonate monooxygenase SsuD/methylene tetrahydromethanopterin reductase-like flavin-dependent oxidoreductase (luciferase family)